MSSFFRCVLGLCVCCLLFSGCAGLSQRDVSLSQYESNFVRDAFETMRARQAACFCLDAEIFANLAISRWIGGGSVAFSGYLQALAPSSIRFTGINPLGQPQFLLIVADGEFQSVIVPEAKMYNGSVQAKTFAKYTPPGFNPDDVYSWLTGQVPDDIIAAASVKPADKKNYWLEFARAEGSYIEKFLFDVGAGIIVRRTLAKRSGNIVVEATYEDHRGNNLCQLPRSLTLASPSQKSTVNLVLNDVVECEDLPPATFRHITPSGFEEIVVQ